MYCSNEISINEQHWPIYNLSAIGVTVTPASAVPRAIYRVRHANFLERNLLVDLTARDAFSQLRVSTISGSLPCKE